MPNAPKILFNNIEQLNIDRINKKVIIDCLKYLQDIRDYYTELYKKAFNLKDQRKLSEDNELISLLKRTHHNEKLKEFVTNRNEFKRIVEYKGELIQKIDPIYLDPDNKFVKAHFYAPRKQVFGKYVTTIWVNVVIIWGMSVLFFIMLYFRILRGIVEYFEI